MIYSRSMMNICDTVLTQERQKEISKKNKFKVLETLLGYNLGLFDYTHFTSLDFITSSERKAIRLASKQFSPTIFAIRLVIIQCLNQNITSARAIGTLFEKAGLDRSDYHLVTRLSEMRLKTKAIKKAKSSVMPLDIPSAEKVLSSLISDIQGPLHSAVKKRVRYVYDSQNLSSEYFLSILIERSIIAFYKYYPYYNMSALRLSMAKSGHNYIENIRAYYAVEDRSRIDNPLADISKTHFYSGKGAEKLSINNTVSFSVSIGDENSGADMSNILPDKGVERAFSDYLDSAAHTKMQSKLSGTKLDVYNVLTMTYDSGFLAYCHKEYGIKAPTMQSVISSAIEEDSMVFPELVRKYFKVGPEQFYSFLDEVIDALALPKLKALGRPSKEDILAYA